MTRRRVVFTDTTTGAMYTTPEYNGDKTEFNLFSKRTDLCDKDWDEIFLEFKDVKSLAQFIEANTRAQSYYHSFLGNEILPVEKIECIEDISCDMIIEL